MSNDSKFNQWEQKIVDGSFFSDTTDALKIAQENDFMVVNADIPDADGFIAVDEEKKLPGYDTNKVIGVRASMNAGDKLDMIAQELGRYFVQKRMQPAGTMKLAQKNALKTKSADIAACIKVVHNTADKLHPEPGQATEKKDAAVLAAVEEAVAEFLGISQQRGLTEEQKDIVAEYTEFYKAFTGEIRDKKDLTEYMTEEQKNRDKSITAFFKEYLSVFQTREHNKITYRKHLFYGSAFVAIGIIIASVILLFMWVPKVVDDTDAARPPQLEITLKLQQVEPVDDADLKIYLYGYNSEDDANDDGAGNSDDEAEAMETPVVIKADEDVSNNNDDAANDSGTDGSVLGTLRAVLESGMDDNEFLPVFSALLSEAESDNTGDVVRDIVSLVTVCLTILGSILAIVKLFTAYILPTNEDESMHQLMNTIQENDFEHEMTLLLVNNGAKAAELVEFLKTCKQPPAGSNTGGQQTNPPGGQQEPDKKKKK